MECDSVSNTQSYVVSVKPDAVFQHASTACRSRDSASLTAGIDNMFKQVKEGVTAIKHRLATGIYFVSFFAGIFAGLTAMLVTQDDGLYRTIANIILAGVLTGVVAIIDRIQNLNMLLFQHFFVTVIAVLMLICPPIAIIALAENLTVHTCTCKQNNYCILILLNPANLQGYGRLIWTQYQKKCMRTG